MRRTISTLLTIIGCGVVFLLNVGALQFSKAGSLSHNNNIVFQVGAVSIAGTDPDRPSKVNQDAYFLFQGQNYVGVGVMDGHGLKGHELTSYLREQLPIRLQEQLDSKGAVVPEESASVLNRFLSKVDEYAKFDSKADNALEIDASERDLDYVIRQSLVNAFHLAHVDALECKGVPAGRAGTTCAVALLHCDNSQGQMHLYTAAVGDSKGILVFPSTEHVKALTVKTTTDLVHERERIEAGQGRIDKFGNVFYGPVGIAMTRSLGNGVMLRAGVVPTPVVLSHGPYPDDAVVVLGTDGVFDVLSDKALLNLLVNKRKTPVSLDESLGIVCEQAKRNWLGELQIECKIDDITCVALRASSE